MSVLKPDLIWVENRCYRYFENTAWKNARNITAYEEDSYEVDFENEEESCDDDIEIVPYRSTQFKHTFHVAKSFFPYIVGTKNAVRKQLETETNTVIQVPKIGEDADIAIIGANHKGIKKARRRIDLLIETSRKKLPPTHFLSIPLCEGHIIMKFDAFKSDVLNHTGKNVRGVEEMIFQKPTKLHLTIGMLRLFDDEERNKAIEALSYCQENIIKPILEEHGQINIRLQGTEIMNDDPSETQVLYARVVNSDNGLQEIADKILDYYDDIGLVKKERGHVKLHATLMNVSFQYDETTQTKWNKKPNTFDATEIMNAHKDTFFGETILKEIHISQRHTISNHGYYQATAKINLLEH